MKKPFDRQNLKEICDYNYIQLINKNISMHLNRSSTRKLLYSEPATDRSKANSLSSYEPTNSFTYEIVIKTNESSVPQIQIVKGTKLNVTKQMDFSSAMKLMMFFERKKIKIIRQGFKQIQLNNKRYKRQISSTNIVEKVVKNKQISLMSLFFIQLSKIKKSFQKRVTSCKFLYFSANNLQRKIKKMGFDAIKSQHKHDSKKIVEEKEIRSTKVTPQKVHSKPPLQPKEKSFSKKFIDFCKSTIKLNLSKDKTIFLKNLATTVSQQQILLDSKKKNSQKQQGLLFVLELIKYLLKQLLSYNNKQESIEAPKKSIQRKLKTESQSEVKKNQKQTSSILGDKSLVIIKNFNQCLVQDSYQKWQKFTKSQDSDPQAKSLIAKLQQLNDILNNKIQSGIAEKKLNSNSSELKLRKQVEQLKAKLQKNQKMIKQLNVKAQGQNQKLAMVQSVPASPIVNQEDERISKKQYNQVLNANTKMNQRITATNKKIDQLLRNVDDKNKLIQEAKIPVEQISEKFCQLNEEESVLLRKISLLQDTIDNLKSTIRIGNQKDEKIQRLRNQIRDKNFMISGLEWQLQFSKNPLAESKFPKLINQQAHNQSQATAAQAPEVAEIKEENQRLKQLNRTLEQQCKMLRQENQRMFLQIKTLKTKLQTKQQIPEPKTLPKPQPQPEPQMNGQAVLSNVTSLQNVVVLLSNMLSFMMRISPKFVGVNNQQEVKNIYEKLTQIRLANPENDQIFLQNCQKYVVNFIKACVN